MQHPLFQVVMLLVSVVAVQKNYDKGGLQRLVLLYQSSDMTFEFVYSTNRHIHTSSSLSGLSRNSSNVSSTAVYDVPSTVRNSDDAWYDLQGRKIVHGTSSKGTSKGVYIHNGKKVVR